MLEKFGAKLQKTIESLEEKDNKCRICSKNDIDTVLLNCGHVCVCKGCSSTIKNCPCCKESISKACPFYKPTTISSPAPPTMKSY